MGDVCKYGLTFKHMNFMYECVFITLNKEEERK